MKRLHGVGVLNNAWGFIPGEAAGVLLLERGERNPWFPASSPTLVLHTGTGQESCRTNTTNVCVGYGLTNAFRSTFTALPRGARMSIATSMESHTERTNMDLH
jgi:3-oxoacyl-[acyl-carrier-protein] synthase-1